MRKLPLLAIALAAMSTLAFRPAEPAREACNVTLTRLQPTNQTVATFQTGLTASWHIKNNSATSFTISSQTPTSTGAITGTTANAWITIPGTFPGSFLVDADMNYDTGAAGSGTVGLTLNASCGSIVFPAYNITIQ
jgi:hypothetical protein